MGKIFGRAAAAALILALAAPLGAQSYSEGFTFLKAVRDRDGNKATEMVSQPGTTVINVRDSSGDAALHIVTRGRDLTWLAFLLAKGARPDIQNGKGETPLSLAVQIGWSDGVEQLLDHGANVDLSNARGETPLILAVHNRDVPMVRVLLAHGASPSKTDHAAGYSALDYARQDSRAQPIVRMLEAKAGSAPRL